MTKRRVYSWSPSAIQDTNFRCSWHWWVRRRTAHTGRPPAGRQAGAIEGSRERRNPHL